MVEQQQQVITEQKFKKCPNCQNEIEDSKFRLHEARCAKENIKCIKCGVFIPKSDLDSHEKEMHSLVKCKYCDYEQEKEKVLKHQDVCDKKPLMCEYCENEFKFEHFYNHLDQCSNKTRYCDACKNNITNKDMKTHLSSGQCQKMQQQKQMNAQDQMQDQLKKFQAEEQKQYKQTVAKNERKAQEQQMQKRIGANTQKQQQEQQQQQQFNQPNSRQPPVIINNKKTTQASNERQYVKSNAQQSSVQGTNAQGGGNRSRSRTKNQNNTNKSSSNTANNNIKSGAVGVGRINAQQYYESAGIGENVDKESEALIAKMLQEEMDAADAQNLNSQINNPSANNSNRLSQQQQQYANFDGQGIASEESYDNVRPPMDSYSDQLIGGGYDDYSSSAFMGRGARGGRGVGVMSSSRVNVGLGPAYHRQINASSYSYYQGGGNQPVVQQHHEEFNYDGDSQMLGEDENDEYARAIAESMERNQPSNVNNQNQDELEDEILKQVLEQSKNQK